MINVKQFVRNMLLDVDENSLALTEQRELESLWPLWAAVEEQTLPVGVHTLNLSSDTVEVLLVSFGKVLLTKTTEKVLDATNRSWRTASNSIPRNYLYKGEQDIQDLRIYPPSRAEGKIQVIKNIFPPKGAARWLDVLLAINIISKLSVSDPSRSRLPDVDFCNQLQKLIMESL